MKEEKMSTVLSDYLQELSQDIDTLTLNIEVSNSPRDIQFLKIALANKFLMRSKIEKILQNIEAIRKQCDDQHRNLGPVPENYDPDGKEKLRNKTLSFVLDHGLLELTHIIKLSRLKKNSLASIFLSDFSNTISTGMDVEASTSDLLKKQFKAEMMIMNSLNSLAANLHTLINEDDNYLLIKDIL